jgi:hypothetical protein
LNVIIQPTDIIYVVIPGKRGSINKFNHGTGRVPSCSKPPQVLEDCSPLTREQTTSHLPCCRAASLRSLDFAHVPVVHDSHMTIVPGDRDRIPTRLSDNAPVSSITLPANASTLLEVLRFGGGHVAHPFAWVAHILGQTACRCLSYFPIKCVHRKRRPKSRRNRRHVRTRAATTIAIAGKINNSSLNFQARLCVPKIRFRMDAENRRDKLAA